MDIDLTTKEGMRTFLSAVYNLSVMEMNETQGVVPRVHMVVTKHPGSGMCLITPAIATLEPNFFDEDSKDRFAADVRRFSKEFNALGLIFVSETWAVEFPKNGDEPPPTIEGSLENHPNRVEKLMFCVEHVDLENPETYMASIDNNCGKKIVGPLSELAASPFTGRLTNLLGKGLPPEEGQLHIVPMAPATKNDVN